MTYSFDAAAPRVQKARLALRITRFARELTIISSIVFVGAGVAFILSGRHIGFSLMGVGSMIGCWVIWVHWDLLNLPQAPFAKNTHLDQILPSYLAAVYRPELSAKQWWELLSASTEGRFLLTRYPLSKTEIGAVLTDAPLDCTPFFTEATTRAAALNLTSLAEGVLMVALIKLSPSAVQLITKAGINLENLDDGIHWVTRLQYYIKMQKPWYGGLARDWASGYTPLLASYGDNLSNDIEFAGSAFRTEERTNQLEDLVTDLASANGSAVLIGESGIGKTALLFGLADRLLQGGDGASALGHYQIYSLSAATIVSSAGGPGETELLVQRLFGEAMHAGNIIIALDEAQLFFGQGTGAVNLSQLLLPVIQSRTLKLVLALTPGDWQRLRATSPAMTSLLTPLMLVEPKPDVTMRILADRALILERGNFITTYGALAEAYRLSGRYVQDEAFPGKALKVLEAAANYPDGPFISERSVQHAVETMFGVTVHQADTTESDVLLHLEDKIHERMINQTRAVSVVANALRRARAGVANPHRPIGSFLFLGPTGVGKTELAKSLAALYFHDEHAMVRLDMSEYQQTADIDRILATAATSPDALLPKIRQTPTSVVLFDEIEKAHSGILNLFLQLLDEGQLTDRDGKAASFKDAIIIATSNAGADEIRSRISAGAELASFEEEFVEHLINSGSFKPELLNRFDEIVLFRPLKPEELIHVVHLMVQEVNQTLSDKHLTIRLTDAAAAALVKAGYDARLGARPMRRMVQRRVEDHIARLILEGHTSPGAVIALDETDVAAPAPSH